MERDHFVEDVSPTELNPANCGSFLEVPADYRGMSVGNSPFFGTGGPPTSSRSLETRCAVGLFEFKLVPHLLAADRLRAHAFLKLQSRTGSFSRHLSNNSSAK
jgi:hypothetical protein